LAQGEVIEDFGLYVAYNMCIFYRYLFVRFWRVFLGKCYLFLRAP